MSKNRIDEEGGRLWAKVTADVAPLRSKKPVPVSVNSELKEKSVGRKQKIQEKAAVHAPLPAKKEVHKPLLPEPNLVRQVRQGRRTIDAKIDLHGLTQAEAHAALLQFITRAKTGGKRVLLVITGKGSKMEGILRRALPHWLSTISFVHSHVEAAPNHGGGGAFYVFLRKEKNKD